MFNAHDPEVVTFLKEIYFGICRGHVPTMVEDNSAQQDSAIK